MTHLNKYFFRYASVILAVLMLLVGVFPLTGFEIKASAYSKDYPNTWVNTGNQAEDLIGVAMSQVGYWGTEYGTGTKYGAWYGNTYAPWCGIFISWCAAQAEIPTSVILKSARAIDYRKCGTYHYKDNYTPKRGDIVLYNPNDGNGYYFPSKNSDGTYSRSQHVAIVCSYDQSSGDIWIVHGNGNGDKVCYNAISVSSMAIQAFVTPNYSNSSAPSDSNSTVTLPDTDHINADNVRLREKMSTSSAIITTLQKGTKVNIIASAKDTSGHKWYHVEVPSLGKKGYVYGNYVTVISNNIPQDEELPDNTVNSNDVRLRDAPGTVGTKVIATLNRGQAIEVLGALNDADGEIWYKVSLKKNGVSYIGYIYGIYANVSSVPAITAPNDANSDTVAENGVNLRKNPDTKSDIVVSLAAGQVIDIISYVCDADGDIWYKVQLEKNGVKHEGYIFSSLVNLKTDKDSIPSESSFVTVEFNSSGGSESPEKLTAFAEKEVILPDAFPKKNGYLFFGWSEIENAEKYSYVPTQSAYFKTDTVLYAVWLKADLFDCYDANCDLMFGYSDFSALKNQIANIEKKQKKTDYNKDGKINTADLCILKRKFSNMEVS